MVARLALDYSGPTGQADFFAVMLLDELHQEQRRLSGLFTSRTQALDALQWLRRRHPAARLVHRRVVLSVEEV